MERLDQNELLAQLDSFKAIYLKACKMAKTDKALTPCVEQAYKQLKELIQCEDMVQQYRDEMEADQAEVELVLTTIILELLEQIERGKHASTG